MEKGDRELHTGPDPTSTVPCPLREHQHIAMGRCVEYQRDAGCHCQHALVALRRTEKFLAEPTRAQSAYDATAHADQVDCVRALIERAEAMERNRPAAPSPKPSLAQVYREARAAPQPFLRPPPTPAPTCEIPGCTHALRVNNLSGLCQRHRQEVPSRKRAGLVPDIARATGTAGDLIQSALKAPPATPAKESSMPRYKMAPCKQTGCEAQVAIERSKTGLCQLHRMKHTRAAPKAKPAPRRVNGARQLAAVAAKHLDPPARHASAPPADIVHLLEDKLAHHQEQAAKCERALQALR